MAIVPNLDGQGIKANGAVGVVDPSYTTPTVFAAGVPATAGFASELRADTATGDIYRCLGGATPRWVDYQ